MSSVNKVILIGNLGADPEMKTFENGGKICNMRLACSERWKDKNTGEQREKTEWVNVVVKNERLADICAQYLQRGSQAYFEGKLETRKYTDQNGNDKYFTEVVVGPYGGEMRMIGGRGDKAESGQSAQGSFGGSQGAQGGFGGSGGGFGAQNNNSGSGGFSGGGGGKWHDDEIPFGPDK